MEDATTRSEYTEGRLGQALILTDLHLLETAEGRSNRAVDLRSLNGRHTPSRARA